MDCVAAEVAADRVLRWRDLYRRDMSCQVVHGSLIARPGWVQSYLLAVAGAPAGYGLVARAGPWAGRPAVVEFHVLPDGLRHAFDLFAALLAAGGAVAVEAQSNDPLLTVMLHLFARDVASESIVFRDGLATAHPAPAGATFRRATPADAGPLAAAGLDPDAGWVIEAGGGVAAAGGVLYHYNRPYGDVYMAVAEPHRRRGLGRYLVQELKRACCLGGGVPAARCGPANVASRRTLLAARVLPCARPRRRGPPGRGPLDGVRVHTGRRANGPGRSRVAVTRATPRAGRNSVGAGVVSVRPFRRLSLPCGGTGPWFARPPGSWRST